MISITGQLAIRTISGRLGLFNVGRLSTSIGEFTIKDALLISTRRVNTEVTSQSSRFDLRTTRTAVDSLLRSGLNLRA